MRRCFGVTLLLSVLGGLACFDDGESGLPAAPAGFHIVHAGSFRMGEPDPWNPPGGRRVELSRAIIMAQHEFTLGRYLPLLNTAWAGGELEIEAGWIWDIDSGALLLKLDPAADLGYDALGDSFALAPGAASGLPLRFVNWYGAALACDWLNRAQDLPESYDRSGYDWLCGPFGNPYEAEGWRLPTEAEWESAARAPDQRVYPWGDLHSDCELANGASSEGGAPCAGGPRVVGSHSPAGDAWYGMADMAGNLREWCQDWQAEWLYNEPLTDPWDIEVQIQQDKCLRGGSWAGPYERLRSWHRDKLLPESADLATGFRIVRRWPGP